MERIIGKILNEKEMNVVLLKECTKKLFKRTNQIKEEIKEIADSIDEDNILDLIRNKYLTEQLAGEYEALEQKKKYLFNLALSVVLEEDINVSIEDEVYKILNQHEIDMALLEYCLVKLEKRNQI